MFYVNKIGCWTKTFKRPWA